MRFITEGDNALSGEVGAVVFSKEELKALLEFGSNDATRATLYRVHIDRCYPSTGVGRAVTTDGHVLLILEPAHQRLPKNGVCNAGGFHPRCFSDKSPRMFGVPRDAIETWIRMLNRNGLELVIDCEERGIVTAKVIDSMGMLVSEMKAAAAIESMPFPPYEMVIPDYRPLNQQVVCYAQPWVDAKLLKRFELVQRAARMGTKSRGFRMQLDPGKMSRGRLDSGPIRFDVAGDSTAPCWATGVVMPMGMQVDDCRPEHRELKPAPVPGLLSLKEQVALIAWAMEAPISNEESKYGHAFDRAVKVARRLLHDSPQIVEELQKSTRVD